MIKTLNISLIMLLVIIIIKLAQGNGGLLEVKQLEAKVKEQENNLQLAKDTNDTLALEMEYLKAEPLAIEEQARYELGMIKRGETYYQVIEPIE